MSTDVGVETKQTDTRCQMRDQRTLTRARTTFICRSTVCPIHWALIVQLQENREDNFKDSIIDGIKMIDCIAAALSLRF